MSKFQVSENLLLSLSNVWDKWRQKSSEATQQISLKTHRQILMSVLSTNLGEATYFYEHPARTSESLGCLCLLHCRQIAGLTENFYIWIYKWCRSLWTPALASHRLIGYLSTLLAPFIKNKCTGTELSCGLIVFSSPSSLCSDSASVMTFTPRHKSTALPRRCLAVGSVKLELWFHVSSGSASRQASQGPVLQGNSCWGFN